MPRRKSGTIYEIVIDNSYYCYAEIIPYGNMAFFDYKSDKPLEDLSVLLTTPVLFIVAIYPYILTKKLWKKVGIINLREEFNNDVQFYVYHRIYDSFDIYSSKTGELIKSTREECLGLEQCAIWGVNHIEDRLRAYYSGKPCIWLKDDYQIKGIEVNFDEMDTTTS